MKAVHDATLAVYAAATACVITGTPLVPSLGVISASACIAVASFGIGRYLFNRRHRERIDAEFLADGACPKCGSGRLVEVTSQRDPETRRRVVCSSCSNAYALELRPDGIFAVRLGTTREQ